jgi:hypothetical protein
VSRLVFFFRSGAAGGSVAQRKRSEASRAAIGTLGVKRRARAREAQRLLRLYRGLLRLLRRQCNGRNGTRLLRVVSHCCEAITRLLRGVSFGRFSWQR